MNLQLFLEETRADAREEARAEALEEGRAQGRAEGRAEGRAQGRAEGRAEGRAQGRIAMIKNLVAVGTPIKFILQATGLTEEEISKILADDMPKNLEV